MCRTLVIDFMSAIMRYSQLYESTSSSMALIHGSSWIQASMWSFAFRRFPNAASPRLHNYDLPASGQPLPVGTRSLRCPAEVHYSPTQISQYLTHPSCKLIAIMKTVPFIVEKANHSDIQDLSDDVLHQQNHTPSWAS